MSNNKGSILIIMYTVLLALLLFAGIFVNRTFSDAKLFSISEGRLKALYLAESAVDKALLALKSSYTSGSSGLLNLSSGGSVVGQYNYTISDTSSSQRKNVVASGYIPSYAQREVVRTIDAVTKKVFPPDFYDYALYAADDIITSGSSYYVAGKVIYGDTADPSVNDVARVSGGATHDSSISPLATFDFAALYNIAAAQTGNPNTISGNNVYTPTDISNEAKYPDAFWYSPPTNPSDPTTGTPNVVYVQGDMVLKNKTTTGKTAGGFFIVVGTNPGVTVENTTMDGGITVNGSIYTTGYFRDNGGGSKMNVNGGVWAGTDVDLNGGIDVSYNNAFMMAIKHLVDAAGASGGLVQVLTWKIEK